MSEDKIWAALAAQKREETLWFLEERPPIWHAPWWKRALAEMFGKGYKSEHSGLVWYEWRGKIYIVDWDPPT